MENSNNQNNGNSNTYDNRVSTSGITLFDQEGMMLKLGYLGDSLSLSICEPLVADSGKRTYPEANRHSSLITSDRASALYYEIIQNRILPAIESGTDIIEGIFLNRKKDAILEIRTQNKEIYLVLCTNINEDRVSSNSWVFHFQKTDVVSGYLPDGTVGDTGSVEGAFYLFCKWLDCGLDAITAAAGHSVRKAEQYSKLNVLNHLKGIAAKLGVTVENRQWNRSTSGFAQPNKPENDFMHIPEGSNDELPFDTSATSTSMDDILG